MTAERRYSSPEIREKQAEFFRESIAESLHDPKPENIPQESWDKRIKIASAFLMGASAIEVGEANCANVHYVHTQTREVVSRLWWAHSEEYRRSHPLGELFDRK